MTMNREMGQRIAHIRDELRAYDRKYESNQIKLR